MNRDVAERVYREIRVIYSRIVIDDIVFDRPVEPDMVISALMTASEIEGTEKISGMRVRIFPHGTINIKGMITDDINTKYKERKLVILNSIRQELTRMNDKRELKQFVSGLTESKSLE